ncbi:hypothetical protein J3U56_11555 [Gilliamella sp. B2824]|uniref:hypothetical protein n=1 Tax=Gilliamella sp. B2824 TaxID=2818019 RepID=UPI00226A1C0C|nr:hypothetical protein [Gilliamella sp. B2824]MCX8739958.1 hypothetical protein [Gilliamella sp. B2824]
MKKFLLQGLFWGFILSSLNSYSYAAMLGENKLIEWDETTFQSQYRSDIRMYDLFFIDYKIGDEPKFAFISLSDDVHLYDENNQQAIILIPGDEKESYQNEQYLLTDSYRAKFFELAGLSKDDNVFIYDYKHNDLTSLPISQLNAFAVVDTTYYKAPFKQNDYIYGFKLDEKLFDHHSDYLVSFGKENPFAQEQLTPLSWKKISKDDFPVLDKNIEIASIGCHWPTDDLVKGDSYLSEVNGLQFYLQDYQKPSDPDTVLEHLIILDSDSNMITNVSLCYSEGGGFKPLNNLADKNEPIEQWTGKLLKNEPPVIFDFIYGCAPLFQFINLKHQFFAPKYYCLE